MFLFMTIFSFNFRVSRKIWMERNECFESGSVNGRVQVQSVFSLGRSIECSYELLVVLCTDYPVPCLCATPACNLAMQNLAIGKLVPLMLSLPPSFFTWFTPSHILIYISNITSFKKLPLTSVDFKCPFSELF